MKITWSQYSTVNLTKEELSTAIEDFVLKHMKKQIKVERNFPSYVCGALGQDSYYQFIISPLDAPSTTQT